MLAPLVTWLAVAALLVIAGGCAVNPVTGQSEFMLVSQERELALGREAYPELRWQDGGPLQVDAGSQAYLAGIVRTLHAVSHRPDLPVDFTLHSASVPNAWAIPGHTAMNRGLLQALENEAQFAFVMGHEMGHVAARHSAKRGSYALLGSGLLGIAGLALAGQGDSGGRALGELALGVGAIGTNLLLLKYDRGQELEADRLGVLYMARAGYDPREALRAHEVLNRAVDQHLANIGKRREEPGPLAELLSTHPRHEVRVSEVQQFIQALPPGEVRIQGDGRFAERWATRTASIRALAPAYAHDDRARMAFAQGALATAQRELDEAVRLAAQAQFSLLQGAIFAKQGRFEDAQQAFARALARYPDYQPGLHGVGVAEFGLGRYANAVPYLEASLRLRPEYAPSRYVLGLALARLGRDREAIPHVIAVAEANPRHPDVYGILAQLYERVGDQRAAFGAWRTQLRVAPDSELGGEARQRMRVLATRVSEPYSNARVRVRLERPALWEVVREQGSRRGGEVVLRREDPAVVIRVASQEYGAPQDVDARLDELIRERLGGTSARIVRENRDYRLGRRSAIAKSVEYGRVEHLFAATARAGRVYWVDVAAERETWRQPEVREEIRRILDSLDF
ncbi:MAG: M48 family metalloprotease [Candidatus Rokubacteria bacterium]|nr:M48 family metalloprotease [Candidatus Rokubacteria bacterium]